MISISRLYCGASSAADNLRYGAGLRPGRKPVVVWNTTRRCNLVCAHCYSVSDNSIADNELSTAEARAMIGQLGAYGCPILLLSGGEPLLRQDLPELATHAVALGLRVAVSSNGTLLDDALAMRLKEAGVAYIGVSLDGLEAAHDRFRGAEGAFASALKGIRAARRAGIKAGIRFTLMQCNVRDVPGIFALLADEGLPRLCFYHLVHTGRGAALAGSGLDHEQTRAVLEVIIDQTAALHARGIPCEVLTVDNHSDGPYLYLKMCREHNPRAARALDLLRQSGGNGAGETIGCVSWDGTVYPDQFWRSQPLGSVRDRSFGGIWEDTSIPLLHSLKHKQEHVTGRCKACRFLDVCGGNLRARAEAATGHVWGVDPACYLTGPEVSREQ